MSNGAHLGVTAPLSNATPNERDLKLNDTLTQELKAQNNFAPEEDVKRRETIIAKLTVLLQRMVLQVGKKKGLPQSILDVAGGKVFTFGSYRLGVFGPGSDVDTLMVAPKHVSREDFFELMPAMLKESPELGEVSEPNPVPGISVPIIKVDIQGVDIDLIFCSLHLSAIPDSLVLDDTNLLRGLQPEDVRSLNGTRVTNRILQLVPQTRIFRLALRAVKLWAQRRGIYGNIVGFPGGVAYAMMVARICQLYPMAAAPLIIHKFFYIMRDWPWPQPVRLQNKEDVGLQLQREWDPSTSRADAANLMPVITPAYPVQNSTHTITASTKRVMLAELTRAHSIVTEVYDGKRQWVDLFQRHTFFTETYRHFICVITAAKSDKAQKGWTGFVQSKLKVLAAGIEDSDATSVEVVQPFNKGFDRVHRCSTPAEVEKTLEGSLDCQVTETKTTEQTNEVKVEAAAQANGGAEADASVDGKLGEDGPQMIYTTAYFLGIGLKKGANSLDISMPISNFKDLILRWLQYDADIHSIQIKYMRNFDLPPDVFVAGEVKPTKKKKAKTMPKSTDAENNKRSFSNAGMDENAAPAKRRQSANVPGPTSTPNGAATPTTNGLQLNTNSVPG